ncbi:MAG: pyridoxamine 5'-phosphate oxidase family protein [Synergistaceae bacterium]|nr:pyridoxamine 5'-phosphate oxidase family protein [Synergistaceae bacterium]
MAESVLDRVADILTKAKVFQFLTVDGNKPKGRPFSFFMVHEGRLVFGTGTHKECYRQMQANPNVEVLAFGGNEFVRIDGEAEYLNDPAIQERAFAEFSYMPKLYNPENGRVISFFTLKNATAEICSLAGEHKELFTL